jgi:hypothetical protein
MTRLIRAQKIARNCLVRVGRQKYVYLKETGYYLIDLKSRSCTCPDKYYRGGLCKHLMAAGMIEKRLSGVWPLKRAGSC